MKHYADSEGSVCAILCQSLKHCPEKMADAFGWPAILKVSREFALDGCRVDILVEHVDKSVTLIEVKNRCGQLRDLVTGIGQLHMQRIQYILRRGVPSRIRMVLAIGDDTIDMRVIMACVSADVEPMAVGSLERFDAVAESIFQQNAERKQSATVIAFPQQESDLHG